MRRPRWSLTFAGTLAVLGCGGERPTDEELVANEADGIVGGSLDTTHQAVVAWIHGGKCSATIIKVNTMTGVGHALTAGHCVPGVNGELRQGNDHNGGYIAYPVTNKQTHPYYGQGVGLTEAYDVAIVTFAGATAATPVLNVLTPAQDAIAAGTQLDLVGYGLTPNNNSLRWHVVKPVDSESDLFIRFDQTVSGMCSGDSGGPSLVNVGQEMVAGVHSRAGNAMNQCAGSMAMGIDIRASAFWDTFISPVINGTSQQPQSCAQCYEGHAIVGWDGDCEAQTLACFQSQSCLDYLNCANGCTQQICVNLCKLNHAAGAQLNDAINSCVCNTACPSVCGGEGFCSPPACGIDFTNDTCQACLEANCCPEVQACSVDQTCLTCLSSAFPSGCDTDPETQDLDACKDMYCPTDCTFEFGTSSGAGGSGGVGGADPVVGAGGAGAAPTTAAGNPVDEDGPLVVESCGCRLVGARAGGSSVRHAGALALLGLTLIFGRRRRNRSMRRSGRESLDVPPSAP